MKKIWKNEKKDEPVVADALGPIVSQQSNSAIGTLQNTVLVETALNESPPKHDNMICRDDDRKKTGSVCMESNEIYADEMEKERMKLRDDLKKLKEELVTLRQGRIREEQLRIIRESGVPKVWKT